MRRSFLLVAVVLALLLALSAPQPANADIEKRVKKLEDELSTIKETTQKVLQRLEQSVFDDLPGTLHRQSSRLYEAVVHHGSKTSEHVAKEYPKWLKWAQLYTQDLPKHAATTTTFLQKEGTKHYGAVSAVLTKFLADNGVPKQYINYIVIGSLAFVGLIATLATLSLLSSVLGALCFCCRKSPKKNVSKKEAKKQEQRAKQQHAEHEKKLHQ